MLVSPSAQAQSGVATGSAAADLDVRLSQMQDQLRALTGQIESQQHDIDELKAQTNKVNADTQMRLGDLEAKTPGGALAAAAGAGPTASSQPHAAEAAPTELTPDSMYGPATGSSTTSSATTGSSTAQAAAAGTLGTLSSTAAAGATPEKEYETAYNFLGQNDYASAETGFKNFLVHYPKHALAPNAAYWLADTYFRRNMFDQAATAFADSYKTYPTSPKAPDSLLDLGLTLGQQGKTQEACLTFNEVLKQFPAASAKIKTAVAQERAHYKCQ